MFEIGSSLREARLRQGFDLPQVEQATKIRGKYLAALEDEQFQLLPAQTYVKGFLRTYAEYLGLDGQLYVDEFNSRYGVGEEEMVHQQRPRRAPAPRGPRIQSRVVLMALLGIATVTALVIVAWTRGGANTPTIPGLEQQQTVPREPVHRAPLARLTITAVHGPSWLQVHSGSYTGPIKFQGTLEPGEQQRFVARRFWVQLSQPENVRLILNSHLRTLPAGARKTFIVTPRAIKPTR